MLCGTEGCRHTGSLWGIIGFVMVLGTEGYGGVQGAVKGTGLLLATDGC